jgi:hypothetical protein
MEIRRDSWHYRFYEVSFNMWPPERTNLCSYFWRVAYGIVLYVALGACVLFILGATGYALYNHTVASLIVAGVTVVLLGLILLGIYVDDELALRRSEPGYRPGLIRSYLKAKKEKVCPLVKFVDPPTSS